jgi:hypothetical protein
MGPVGSMRGEAAFRAPAARVNVTARSTRSRLARFMEPSASTHDTPFSYKTSAFPIPLGLPTADLHRQIHSVQNAYEARVVVEAVENEVRANFGEFRLSLGIGLFQQSKGAIVFSERRVDARHDD